MLKKDPSKLNMRECGAAVRVSIVMVILSPCVLPMSPGKLIFKIWFTVILYYFAFIKLIL